AASPRALTLSEESLTIGQAPQPALSARITGPTTMSPGQQVSFDVEIRNDGLQEADNVAVLVRYPDNTDFLSATPGYSFYNVGHFVNGSYQPFPVIRWDFAQIP